MSRRMRLLLRGLLLEASFNPRGMQRGGVEWVIGPGSKVDRASPFNANPVLAGYAIGWIASSKEGASASHLGALASALGGIGDRLVWGGLRLIASAIAVALSFLGPFPAALAYLLVYNPPELALRWRSASVGLEGIEAIRADLSLEGLPRLVPLAGRLGAMAAGVAAGSLFAGGWLRGAGAGLWVAAATAIVLFAAMRRREPAMGWAAGIALLLGLAWMALRWIAG